jgi:hypothetical protein
VLSSTSRLEPGWDCDCGIGCGYDDVGAECEDEEGVESFMMAAYAIV